MNKTNLKLALIAAILTPQIAINIGEFPVTFDFILLYTIFALLVWNNSLNYSLFAILLFSLVVCVGSLSLLNSNFSSSSALLLLLVLYAPFIASPKSDFCRTFPQSWVADGYISAAYILSVMALLQFGAVNIFGISSLSNISNFLPDGIVAAGKYATAREADGGIAKSNGFLLREASSLSGITALAFILEYTQRRRPFTLTLLLLGQISSISGSGVLSLILALLIPNSIFALQRTLSILAACIFGYFLAEYLPFAQLWIARFTEFSTPNTSGYARYVAPYVLIQQMWYGVFNQLFGLGPGSFSRVLSIARFSYEVNDPTWAKLLFEYGVVGAGAVFVFVVRRLWASNVVFIVAAYIMTAWLTTGAVVKSEFVLPFWLLTAYPRLSANDRHVDRGVW